MAKNTKSTNFLDNYRNAIGITSSPLTGAVAELGDKRLRLRALPQGRNTWYSNYAQNSGIDATQKARPDQAYVPTGLNVENRGKGAPLINRTIPSDDMLTSREERRLWRLDGAPADRGRYEAKLEDIKREITGSNSFDDTSKILKKYANNWDLNMYMIGADNSDPQSQSYDWSPANMFQQELEGLKYRKQEGKDRGEEYTNDYWKKDLIATIDSALNVREEKRINPARLRLV